MQPQREFGVDWILVEHPGLGLKCPYHNSRIWVCRLDGGTQC